MVKFLRSWCEGIIVALVISILIETILPQGTNKKYVKVVIGIYIIFTILNPLLRNFCSDFEIDKDMLNLPTVETASISTDEIQKMYANGIEKTLEKSIEEEFGYTAEVKITYQENYEDIEKISVKIKENGISKIETVKIGETEEEEKSSNNSYPDVRKYIIENYKIDSSKIMID